MDENTKRLKRFDRARLLILTKEVGCISEVVDLVINGKEFKIRAMEEPILQVHESVIYNPRTEAVSSYKDPADPNRTPNGETSSSSGGASNQVQLGRLEDVTSPQSLSNTSKKRLDSPSLSEIQKNPSLQGSKDFLKDKIDLEEDSSAVPIVVCSESASVVKETQTEVSDHGDQLALVGEDCMVTPLRCLPPVDPTTSVEEVRAVESPIMTPRVEKKIRKTRTINLRGAKSRGKKSQKKKVSERSGPDKSSVSDSDIRRRNINILKEAFQTWQYAQDCGIKLVRQEQEADVIKLLMDLEDGKR